MSYSPITNQEIQAGAPLDTLLLNKIKGNFEAHVSDLSNKEDTIETQGLAIDTIEQDLAAKQITINGQTLTLSNHDALLTSHTNSIASHQATLTAHINSLSDINNTLTSHTSLLTTHGNQLTNLDSEVQGMAANPIPVAVSVKTASYTIPAGRYAKIVVNLEGSATFTIGGATALRGTQNSVIASDNISTTSGQETIDAFGTVGTRTALLTRSSTASNPATANGTAFNETTDQKTVVAEFTLPTGTVINGTGTWRATVMEFTV